MPVPDGVQRDPDAPLRIRQALDKIQLILNDLIQFGDIHLVPGVRWRVNPAIAAVSPAFPPGTLGDSEFDETLIVPHFCCTTGTGTGTGTGGGMGPPGQDGSDGDDGAPGPPGPAGAAGASGSAGPTGPAVYLEAEPGDDGLPGFPGAAGAAGATGAQGPTGPAIYLMADDAEEGMRGPPGPTGAAGAGGGGTWTEVEVDFGSTPVFDAQFTITDAGIASSSKVIIQESGKLATGRATGDAQWDSVVCAANPGTGSATVYAIAHPGPVVGKRKLHYTVAA